MKKTFIIIVLLLIVFASLVYVDYFNTKTNKTFPKLALKSENDDAVIYTAILYRVWYCKVNKMYMIGSYSEKDVCPKNYEYVNEVYTNSQGVNITKRDLQLLTKDGVYTSEMIENLANDKQVEDAVYVAYNYLKTSYKVINETETNKIVVFPEFKEVNGNYEWVYDESDNYYCLSKDGTQVAKFDNLVCGKYVKIKMDERWCESYKTSTLVYDENVESLCD